MPDHNKWMSIALEEAILAADRGEVPVGAAIIDPHHELVAKAGNRTIELKDPTAHAEILAIRTACEKSKWERLLGCTLYVTLEPCAMCAAALSFARLRTVCYGAPDPKGGAIHHGPIFFQQPTCHHKPTVISGIMELESSLLLKNFFKKLR